MEELEGIITELLQDTPMDLHKIKNGCIIKTSYCSGPSTYSPVYNYKDDEHNFNIGDSDLNWKVSQLNKDDIIGSTIGISEVLKTFQVMNIQFCFGQSLNVMCGDISLKIDWDLSKTLGQQSENVISAISRIYLDN